jgi:prephenate dehydrogenase
LNVSVAGLGLIGGSLALALKSRHRVTGFDTDARTREAAAAAGIDVVGALDALLPADAVIIATPMDAVVPTFESLARRAGTAVLLDVSSVRGPVESFASSTPAGCRIVGFHPMAGRSGSGFGAASAELLELRPFLIVPTSRSDTAAMAVAGTLARDAGGIVTVFSAEQHDRIVALLSALPVAVAAALALAVSDAPEDPARFSGPGFRDATRLAGTPVDLSEQLLRTNRGNVIAAMARLRAALDAVERAVAADDPTELRALLAHAAEIRARLDQGHTRGP